MRNRNEIRKQTEIPKDTSVSITDYSYLQQTVNPATEQRSIKQRLKDMRDKKRKRGKI